MAKVSSVEKNLARKNNIARHFEKRKKLKEQIYKKDIPLQERYDAIIKLSRMSRSSSAVRFRNRCAITGRPRGYYRDFDLGRNKLRELASFKQVAGLIKASW